MTDTTTAKVVTDSLKTQWKDVKATDEKAFFLPEKEWNQYLLEVTPSVQAFWKRNGFPKAVNPKTGLEEECIKYKRIPVFKTKI